MPDLKIFTLSDAAQKDVVASIIEANGRNVTFLMNKAREICPNCLGGDQFCSVCGGEGFVETSSERKYISKVIWKGSEKKRYQVQGQDFDGDCKLTIAITDYLESDLAKTHHIIVDNKSCVIDNWYPRGTPNRIDIVLKEDSSPITRV